MGYNLNDRRSGAPYVFLSGLLGSLAFIPSVVPYCLYSHVLRRGNLFPYYQKRRYCLLVISKLPHGPRKDLNLRDYLLLVW